MLLYTFGPVLCPNGHNSPWPGLAMILSAPRQVRMMSEHGAIEHRLCIKPSGIVVEDFFLESFRSCMPPKMIEGGCELSGTRTTVYLEFNIAKLFGNVSEGSMLALRVPSARQRFSEAREETGGNSRVLQPVVPTPDECGAACCSHRQIEMLGTNLPPRLECCVSQPKLPSFFPFDSDQNQTNL